MRRLALSTAWRASPRKSGAEILDEVLRVVHERPVDGLVLDAGWSAEALEQVRVVFMRREVPLLALRGPVGRAMPSPGVRDGSAPDAEVPEAPPTEDDVPGVRARGGGRVWFTSSTPRKSEPLPVTPRRPTAARPPRLAAPDADERAVAVQVHERALTLASELEVPLCTWPLGVTDPEALPPLTWLGPWTRAVTQREHEALQRATKRAEVLRRPCFDAARFSLETLAKRAQKEGVTIALENPPVPMGLPNAEELHRLFAQFAGAPLAYAHDFAAARLNMALGGAPGKESFEAGRDQLRLVYVADAKERHAWLPLGRGELSIEGLVRATGDVPLVLAPRADWTRADVDEGLERLREAMTATGAS